MANQIQATVYQIDGSPLNNSIQIAFLTNNVSMREFQTDLIPEVNSAIIYYPNTSNQLQEQTFLVSETIFDLVTLANIGGTSQISTTVLEINQEPQIPSGLIFSFPVQGISIWPVANPIVDGVNSYIEFKNKKYYLLEDENTLVTTANTNNSGSTGVNGLNGTTSIGLGGNLTQPDTKIFGGGVCNLWFGDQGNEISQFRVTSKFALSLALNTADYTTNIFGNNAEFFIQRGNANESEYTKIVMTEKNISTEYGTSFKGIALDFDSEFYTLGDSSTFIKSDSQNNEIILSITPKINTGTITNTATATFPPNYLSININGNDYKILLFNP